jgi:outer membrane protein
VKKRINLLLSLLLLSSPILSAAPKIATINVAEAISECQLNKDDIAAYEVAKAKLAENPRKKALDEMAEKIKALQAKMAETKQGSDEQAQIIEEGKEASAAYDDINSKWMQFENEEMRAITEAFIDATTRRTDEILRIARDIGESEGFDWVLETNGKSNSKLPLVLYVRNGSDITPQVIEEINQATPATEEQSPTQPE